MIFSDSFLKFSKVCFSNSFCSLSALFSLIIGWYCFCDTSICAERVTILFFCFFLLFYHLLHCLAHLCRFLRLTKFMNFESNLFCLSFVFIILILVLKSLSSISLIVSLKLLDCLLISTKLQEQVHFRHLIESLGIRKLWKI